MAVNLKWQAYMTNLAFSSSTIVDILRINGQIDEAAALVRCRRDVLLVLAPTESLRHPLVIPGTNHLVFPTPSASMGMSLVSSIFTGVDGKEYLKLHAEYDGNKVSLGLAETTIEAMKSILIAFDAAENKGESINLYRNSIPTDMIFTTTQQRLSRLSLQYTSDKNFLEEANNLYQYGESMYSLVCNSEDSVNIALIEAVDGDKAGLGKGKGIETTYRALLSKVFALSQKLKELFPRSNTGEMQVVVLDLSDTMYLYIAMLAVSHAGFTFVPADRKWVKSNVEHVRNTLSDSIVAVIKLQNQEARDFGTTNVLSIDHIVDGITNVDASDNTCAYIVEPDDIAYILFTSGSTGTPKACRITNFNIVSMIRSQQMYVYKPCKDDIILHLCSPLFEEQL